MQSVDLSWLRYVCYGLWAAAAGLFLSARTDVRGIQKPVKIATACLSIFIAMSVWTVQEHHSQAYSPRVTVTGTVSWVIEDDNKGGSFSDEFMLFSGAGLSPTLSTGVIGGSNSVRPIAQGDVLTVAYRTWDSKVMSIEELSGNHPGWQYRYSSEGLWMIYVGAVIAAGGLVWLFTAWRAQREGHELIYEDDLPNPPEEIQTLGLGSGDQ